MKKPTPEQLDKFLEYETLYNKLCENQSVVDVSLFGDTVDINGNPIKDVINLRFDVKKLILLAEAVVSETPKEYKRKCMKRFNLVLDAMHNYPHIKPLVNKYLMTYDSVSVSKFLINLRRTNYSPIVFGPKQYNGEELYISGNCKCTKHPSDYFESEGIQYYMEYNLGDEREVLR